jgi:ATP-binding cassette subfamily C protein LapB
VGSGKSTLIKILTGLYKPSEGRVFFDDVDMSHVAPEFLREQIGYLPQDVRLFSGTLRDNLTIGLPSPTDDQILAAASKTGLDKIIQGHPKGLGIEISEGGRGLSGGQRQVVGLTRLILARPKVIILDEPTASLDNDLEAFIMSGLFQSMSKDTTVIIATHKLPLLSFVGRVTLVNKGQIMIDGPRNEVIQKISSLTSNVKNFDPSMKANKA